METIIEIVCWPLGEALIDLISGIGSDPAGKADRPRVAICGPCAYCRKRGGRFVTCRTCRTPHHHDCAKVNGRCAVYGCRTRKFLVPAA